MSMATALRSLRAVAPAAPRAPWAPTSVLATRFVRAASTTSSGPQDLVVIGGGPGGYAHAIKAAQLGLKVTCVEKRGTLGGTCLNVGCIPSKALLHSSHLYEDARTNFAAHGVVVKDVGIDLPAMMKHKDGAVSGLTKGIEGLFKKNKVTYVKGTGSLVAGGSGEGRQVKVSLVDGGETTIDTKSVTLATGSVPSGLPGLTVDEKKVITSDGGIALSEVPKKMVVIGGGVIGLELGSVWRRLGSQVTVVEYLDRILTGMDSETAAAFHKILKRQKMGFKLSTKVTGADTSGDGVVLTVEPSAGGEAETIEADVVLVATGRRPFTSGLGLEEAGVELDKVGRVVTDEHFRTSAEGVYAIGDIIAGPMLAHKAEDEGLVSAEMIAGGAAAHVDYNCVPSVVYTHPEVASVGKTEEQLVEAGVEFRKGVFPFMANSRARTNDVKGDVASGMVKVLADAKTDQLLGMHIVGPNAGELIAEGVFALEYGASAEDIGRTSHAHPTLSEAVKEASMAAYGKPIHF